MPDHAYSLTRRPFIPAVSPPPDRSGPAYWFAFQKYRLLVQEAEVSVTLPVVDDLAAVGVMPVRTQYLGRLGARDCFSAEIAEGVDAPAGWEFRHLRSLYNPLDDDLFWIAGRAVQIVAWDRTHQFCSRCGTPTESDSNERVKVCPNCGHSSYPRLAPAVIVAVTRGDQILLARSHRHPPGLFSVLAGFVEPGETLEECVRREIKEEVGLDVKNVRYFGSQPWPFPHSLMIAFTCEHAAGEIVLEEEEMAEAYWYPPDDLPRIPPPMTISRKLIDDFVNRAG